MSIRTAGTGRNHTGKGGDAEERRKICFHCVEMEAEARYIHGLYRGPAAKRADEKRHDEQNEEDIKQGACNVGRGASDSTKSERSRDEGDDEKRDNPA